MKKVLKVALSGSSGRMGQSLKKLIKKSSKFKLVEEAGRKKSPSLWSAKKIDIVIDFSLPPLFEKSITWAIKNKKAFVSGTTGLNKKQKALLKKASRSQPVFYSENMSQGIFLLSSFLKDLPSKNIKISLEDIHHKDKKDKPSGTALRLKRSLPLSLQKKLKIKSLRKGKEFGTHKVTITSEFESLSLEHKAFGRELFSKGALEASLFLSKKKKGFYTLEDLGK